MKNDYEHIFNALAVTTFFMALFCAVALPFIWKEESCADSVETPQKANLALVGALDSHIKSVKIPDVSGAFELKANKEAAKAIVLQAQSIFDRIDSVEAEAYVLKYVGSFYCTKYAATVEQCGNDLGITASGKKVTTNPDCWTVAVDPKVIPLGTKLKIDLPGGDPSVIYEATDTGSAINNFDIDVFTESESESTSWANCYVDVWIIED